MGSRMVRSLDKNTNTGAAEDSPASQMEDFLGQLRPEVRRPKPSPEAIAAAMESAQRLAAEADAENGAEDMARKLRESGMIECGVCGYCNREGTKFCGMCGVAIETRKASAAEPAPSQAIARALNSPPAEAAAETPAKTDAATAGTDAKADANATSSAPAADAAKAGDAQASGDSKDKKESSSKKKKGLRKLVPW